MRLKNISSAFLFSTFFLFFTGLPSPNYSTGTVPVFKHHSNLQGGKQISGTYTNSQFAFEVKYPPSLLLPVPAVGNIFASKDDQVRLKVSGEYNDVEKTLQEEYQGKLNTYGSGEVTYKATGKNYFVISGVKNERVFYLKEILVGQEIDNQILISFDMEFPKSMKETWDPVLVECVKTFGEIKGEGFISEKDRRADNGVWSDNFSGLPGVSFKVVPGNGSAQIIWEAVVGALSYDLHITEISPVKSDLSREITLPNDASQTVVDGLTNDATYEFKIAPIFRPGKGAWCLTYKTISSEPFKQLSSPANLVITPGNGSAHLSWNPVPRAGFYNIHISSDGTYFGRVIGNVKDSTTYDVSSLKNGQKYYFAVEPRCIMCPDGDWAVQEVVPGSAQAFSQEPTIRLATPPSLTPTPNMTNYQVSGNIELSEAKDGFDGKLLLWLGKIENTNWKPGDSEKFKWRYGKPIIQLVDSSGAEKGRQYFEYTSSLVALQEEAPNENGLPIYLVTSTYPADEGGGYSFTRILQISSGELAYLETPEPSSNNPNPISIFLERGQAGTEAGNWKWAPSETSGNQDILSWMTEAPRGSIMAPDNDLTPFTDYMRYHFDGKQWICFKKTESGFVGNSQKETPEQGWFPDDAYFPNP